MGSYYRTLWRRARSLYWKRVTAWGPSVILFVVQTALLFCVFYYLPWLGNLSEQAGQAGALVIAVLGSAALLFLYDFVRAPVLIDAEKNETIDRQSKALAEAETRATPRLLVMGLVRKSDQRWCIAVKNSSPIEGITNCLARIEELTDATGKEIMSHVPLATENQVGDRPQGRFNLDPDQTKRVVLAEPVAGSQNFVIRIIGVGTTKKLERGDYKLRLRFSTNTGGSPVDMNLAIRTDQVTVES